EGGSRPLRRETWQIGRVDVQSGEISQVTRRENGAVRPRLSPSGDTLAFATWMDEQPAMVLRSLRTSTESVLTRGIERNLQDMYLSQLDLLPGYAFGPNGQSVVLSHGGHLRRVAVPGGDSEVVPFHVETTLDVPERVYTEASLGDSMPVRMVRWPDVGPAGDIVVYEAVGQLWKRRVRSPGRPPQPLTSPSTHAGQPSLSPDGQAVAFVGGAIRFPVVLSTGCPWTAVHRRGLRKNRARTPARCGRRTGRASRRCTGPRRTPATRGRPFPRSI
ncbi:MAG: hypothetical protein ABEL51_14055, partial [Salinibacter sp.]